VYPFPAKNYRNKLKLRFTHTLAPNRLHIRPNNNEYISRETEFLNLAILLWTKKP